MKSTVNKYTSGHVLSNTVKQCLPYWLEFECQLILLCLGALYWLKVLSSY